MLGFAAIAETPLAAAAETQQPPTAALRAGGAPARLRRDLGTPGAIGGARANGSAAYGARRTTALSGTVLMRAQDGAVQAGALSGNVTSIVLPAAALALDAPAPAVSAGKAIGIPAGAVSLGALAPQLSSGAAIAVPFAGLALAGLAPAVRTGAAVAIPAAPVSLAPLAPGIATGASIQVPSAALALVAIAPSAATGVAVNVQPGLLTLAGSAPTVSAQSIPVVARVRSRRMIEGAVATRPVLNVAVVHGRPVRVSLMLEGVS